MALTSGWLWTAREVSRWLIPATMEQPAWKSIDALSTETATARLIGILPPPSPARPGVIADSRMGGRPSFFRIIGSMELGSEALAMITSAEGFRCAMLLSDRLIENHAEDDLEIFQISVAGLLLLILLNGRQTPTVGRLSPAVITETGSTGCGRGDSRLILRAAKMPMGCVYTYSSFLMCVDCSKFPARLTFTGQTLNDIVRVAREDQAAGCTRRAVVT